MKIYSLALLAAISTTACTVKPAFSPTQEKVVVDNCFDQVQAPGTYSIRPGQTTSSNNPEGALPRVSPVRTMGGTERGAQAVNLCIKRQAGY